MFQQLIRKVKFRKDIGGQQLLDFITYPAQQGQQFKLCKIKALVKIHKGKLWRVRLIFPLCNCPTAPLHMFLAKSLHAKIMRFPSVLMHVYEILNFTSNNLVPKGSIFVKANINTMFPSVDRQAAIEIATNMLVKHNIPNCIMTHGHNGVNS